VRYVPLALTITATWCLLASAASAGDAVLHLTVRGVGDPSTGDPEVRINLSLGAAERGAIPVSAPKEALVLPRALLRDVPGAGGLDSGSDPQPPFRLTSPISGAVTEEGGKQSLQIFAEVLHEQMPGRPPVLYDVTLTADVPSKAGGELAVRYEAVPRLSSGDKELDELRRMSGVIPGWLEIGP
jgi:hypothetical protein